MKSMLALLPLVLLLVFAAPGAAEDGGLPDTMLIDELPNGLQVIVEERHSAPIVHVRAYMRIGAMYEGEYLGCGLSHYMEHLVSGGSTRRQEKGPEGKTEWVGRTEEENTKLLQSIGGNSNASTSLNYTNYYITTKSEMAGTAMDLISGYLQHCQFDPVEVEREQRVVQQELLRNLDNPARARGQLFSETFFKVHPARVPVIGYIDNIDRLTREDMFRFYNRHYTPQNCVLSIVGDVDKHEMLAMAKEYFGTWKRKPLAPYIIPQEPEQTAPRWVEREHGANKTARVLVGIPTIPLLHPDLYKLDMLANVLGLGDSSILGQKFEHDPARETPATGIFASNYTPVYGGGRFMFGFEVDTVENARALVREVWAEIQAMKETLVTQERIDRVLKLHEKYHYLGRADIEGRAQELASSLAWLNDPLFNETYLEKLKKVTPEQVREAAQTWMDPNKLVVTILTPPQPEKAKAEAKDKEAEGQVRKVVLDNGLTLLLKRIPDYGLVDVAAAINGGVIYEDEATNGLFFLMAQTFWRGTESRPFKTLQREMDDLGMELSAESHNNVMYVKMKSLASELEPSMGVFADVMLHPSIDPAFVNYVKGLLLGRVLPSLEVSPDEMVQRVLRNTLYTKSPYRRQRFGTEEAVQTFDAAKVRELYETFVKPNNMVLGIYGDIDLDETEALAKKLFGTWEKGEIPASFVTGDDPGITEPKTVELAQAQARTNYRLAWRAFGRQEREKTAALSVMNAMMGGRGWLHERLRGGDADYVYAVYSAPYTGDQVGHFHVTTDFTPSDEKAVLGIIDGVIADMKAGKFKDDELALAKRMILSYEALGKQENESVVTGDVLSELYGVGYDSDKKHFERIRNVTREDVVKVANEIFGNPALRILVRPEAAAK